MIHFLGSDLVCDCGNKDPQKFNKFLHNTVQIGERQRKTIIKNESIVCWVCKEVLLEKDLQAQILELNKQHAKEESEGKESTEASNNKAENSL